MSYCCVGGCTKSWGRDSSDLRGFLRFHKFPSNKTLCKEWIARIGRQSSDINTKSMVVCSDHFADNDFQLSDFVRAKVYSRNQLKGVKVRIKRDAVPNTDRETGMRRPRPPLKECSRKRRRNVGLARIDELIAENAEVVATNFEPQTGHERSILHSGHSQHDHVM